MDQRILAPDPLIMKELTQVRVENISDLLYMQLRIVENILTLSDVLKIKLHNLVKLMHKDRDRDVLFLDTVGIHRWLDKLRRC